MGELWQVKQPPLAPPSQPAQMSCPPLYESWAAAWRENSDGEGTLAGCLRVDTGLDEAK